MDLLLPAEIINLISLSLLQHERWMLKLTCKTLHSLLKPGIRLLESCILSGDLQLIKEAESWGNKWDDISYSFINSMDIVHYKCESGIYPFTSCILDNVKLRNLYKSACFRSNTEILNYVHILCTKLPITGLVQIVLAKRFDFLDVFFKYNPNKHLLWNASFEIKSIAGVKYCMENKIKPSGIGIIDSLYKKHYNIEPVDSFVEKCLKLGIDFSGLCLPNTIEDFRFILTMMSAGVKTDTLDIFHSNNLGIADWKNEKHTNFIISNITRCLNESTYGVVNRAKIFLRREHVYSDYKYLFTEYKKSILNNF